VRINEPNLLILSIGYGILIVPSSPKKETFRLFFEVLEVEHERWEKKTEERA
jgi:hypothetical protein